MLTENYIFNIFKNVKGSNGQYTALCPCHEDKQNSLSIKISEEMLLFHCFAGCSFNDIMQAARLENKDVFSSSHGRRDIKQPTKNISPKQKIVSQTEKITSQTQKKRTVGFFTVTYLQNR